MSNFPSDLKYTKDHSYVRLEGNIATVGITYHAQIQLGECVSCDVEVKVGDKLAAEDPFGTIESVKAVSEFYSPVTGTIQQVNEELNGSPELINDDPYGDGWIVKIKVDDTSSVDKLLTASQYEEFIKPEANK